MDACVQETTVSLDNAIPRDIKTKKIVAYVKEMLYFQYNLEPPIQKYKKMTDNIIP